MNNNDFEGWRSAKELSLARINKVLSKVDEQPIKGSRPLDEELHRIAEYRIEPFYKEAVDQLRDILRDICRVYLTTTSDQRVEIRGLFNDKLSVLFQLRAYQAKASEHISLPDGADWLLIGLAAVSIEDQAIDYRDSYPLLAQLYIAAARNGIDPDPYFGRVASISSHERDLFGETSVAEMITGFKDKKSGLYKELVEPYL